MGYRASEAPFRIPLADLDGSDNWVDIREGRSYGQSLQQLALAGVVTGITSYGSPQYQSIDLPTAAMALLNQSILAWSLKADDGDAEPMAVSPDAIEHLPEQVAVFLNQRIQSHYQSRLPRGELERDLNGSSTVRS